MQEIFANYHGYKVGNLGTVIGKTGKAMKPAITSKGYHKVFLTLPRQKSRWYKVHRLVALMFCGNPYPHLYKQVNHRDGNKANNNASNLEWCCAAQNIQAKYDLRRLKGLPTLTEREQIAIAKARASRRCHRREAA